MASKKTKTIEAAQKLVAQGKLKEAISEYLKIYKENPKDQNALNTLGDLNVRLKNVPEALGYYIKLADMYVSDGFLVRGIAMYKKISKLEPGNIQAMERLAELYTMQGLVSEARAQYLQLAEAHLKSGQTAPAMEIMQRVLDLDPENVRIQQRLADLYERHERPVEAAGIYRRLAHRLLENDQIEDGRKWLKKALALAPEDAEVLLLQAHVEQRTGQAAKALATLEKIPNLEQHPEAVELLLSARLDKGDLQEAEKLAEKMFSADGAHFVGYLKIAQHAAGQQEGARALELLKRIAEPALLHDPFHLLEALRAVVALLPDSLEAADLLAQAARKTGDRSALVESLNRQAQAAVQAEDFARAKQLYDELVSVEPENPEFSQHLNAMREKLGEPTGPTEAAPAEAAPAAAEVEFDEETKAYINSTLTDIDLFSSYGMTDKAIELAQQLVSRVPDHVLGLEKLLDFYLGSGNDAGVVEIARRLEGIYRRAENEARAEEVATLAQRYAQKVEAEGPPAEVPAAPAAEAPAEPALHEVDLSAEWDMVSATEETAAEAPPAEAAEAPAPAFNATEASEEIDFYLAQGLVDQAREALARYEQQFPGESALADLRARVEVAAPAEAVPTEEAPAEAAVAEEGQTYEVLLEEKAKEPAPAGAPMSADEFFSDLAGDLDQSLAEAPEAAPPPSAPVAAPAPKPAPVPASAAPPAPAAAAEEPPAGVLAEVFEEFKEEMGEVEEVEDMETHYNLGIAYKEMALLDEAISEFQKVSKAAEQQKSYSQLFQCCTLLGVCFMEKGMPQIAVRWYERALKAPGLDEEGALALRYDMGTAHEQAGNRKAALDCFMEVYGANVDYRNVSERIRELQGA